MTSLLDLWKNWRFGRFLVVGGLNTAFGYGVFAAALYLGLRDELAALVATIIGPFFNFLTTGMLVFADNDKRRLTRFLLVYVAVYFVGIAELRVGRLMGISPYITGAVILLPNALLSYVLQKKFVFRPGASQS